MSHRQERHAIGRLQRDQLLPLGFGAFALGLCQARLGGAVNVGIDKPGDGLLELPDDAPVGNDLRDYLKLEDVTLELGLTPNRGDCLGLAGLAREVAAFSRLSFRGLDVASVPATLPDRFPVVVHAPEACPSYVGRVIRGVDLTRPSPLWLQEKLRRSGIRSIDAVVDVTNFVMLEVGQPMHAFDLDTLSGGIVVRMAEAGDALELEGRDPKAAAKIALLDPLLTLSQPASVTACTGIDAIAHAVECAVTKRRNPLSLMFAHEAFKLCARGFPVVLASPSHLEARSRMLLGAAFAGTAIENSMLGATHAAANPPTRKLTALELNETDDGEDD